MKNSHIKISTPLLQKDFEDIIKIVSDNLVFDAELSDDYYKSKPYGEVLVAKKDEQIIGVLIQKGPGKVFEEFPDKQFALEKIKYDKRDLGYIAIIAIDHQFQGHGVGKKLAEEALKFQKGFGSRAVMVHCWSGSPGGASEKLFGSLGFKPLKVFKAPWEKYSRKAGPKNYLCVVCGNPCVCDELEMIKYL